MCLIVVKNSAEASFSVEDFKTSFERNSDGTGVAYINEHGRIVIEKAMGTLKDQLSLYYKHMLRPQFILHQRLATHGEKTELNVHPFYVLNMDEGDPCDLIMAHNGVLTMSKFSSTADKKYSDTNLFVQEYMRPLLRKCPEMIEEFAFQVLIHDFIGTGNKLAFLRSDGRNWIFNKSGGKEHNGCWLSNAYSIETTHVRYNNYGRNHGASTYCTPKDDNFQYEDGVWYREPWDRANRIKQKSSETLTQLDADTILEGIEQYAGMPVKTLGDLFESDAYLVYDMINLMSPKKIDESLLNEKPDVVANQLYDLLQEYSKKKAA